MSCRRPSIAFLKNINCFVSCAPQWQPHAKPRMSPCTFCGKRTKELTRRRGRLLQINHSAVVPLYKRILIKRTNARPHPLTSCVHKMRFSMEEHPAVVPLYKHILIKRTNPRQHPLTPCVYKMRFSSEEEEAVFQLAFLYVRECHHYIIPSTVIRRKSIIMMTSWENYY